MNNTQKTIINTQKPTDDSTISNNHLPLQRGPLKRYSGPLLLTLLSILITR